MLASLIAASLQQSMLETTVTNSNALGFKMLSELTQKSESNACISPLSITTAGTMLRWGAGPKSDPLLAKLLNQDGVSSSRATAGVKELISSFENASEHGTFYAANGIWYSNTQSVKRSFIDAMKLNFKAECSSLDFLSAEAPSTINGWVSKNTNSRINNIFTNFNANFGLVLINCVYLKDQWLSECSDYGDLDFHADSKTSRKVAAFSNSRSSYLSNPKFERVLLGFTSGNFMELYLPARGITPSQLLKSKEFVDNIGRIDGKEIQEAIIPKWQSEYSLSLSDYWKSKGGSGLFSSNQIPFPGISDNSLNIQQSIHKTFIKVDEKGTEAAAASAFGLAGGIPDHTKLVLKFDRPFVYVIVDRTTKTALFVGVVKNPTF